MSEETTETTEEAKPEPEAKGMRAQPEREVDAETGKGDAPAVIDMAWRCFNFIAHYFSSFTKKDTGRMACIRPVELMVVTDRRLFAAVCDQ